MSPQYTYLAPELHSTANSAMDWFVKNWGIKKTSIQTEIPIDSRIDFRPTFTGITRKFHILAVEVSPTIYKNALDAFVLACRAHHLPVLLYVAVGEESKRDPAYRDRLSASTNAGAGIIEITNGSATIIRHALSTILGSVRPIALEEFPSKCRQTLQQAEHSFREGDPPKACASVYDELEAAFRRYAKQTNKKGHWNNSNNLNIDSCPWANLIQTVDRHLDRSLATTKPMTSTLLSRLHGVTSHRNETGHAPKNRKELVRRDKELRTRFEGAVDLLKDFHVAARPFRI